VPSAASRAAISSSLDGSGGHRGGIARIVPLGGETQRADAVAPDRGEQIEGPGALGLLARGDLVPDRRIIR